MQKTGLTYGAGNNHFPVYLAIFGMVTNNNKQPGDPEPDLDQWEGSLLQYRARFSLEYCPIFHQYY